MHLIFHTFLKVAAHLRNGHVLLVSHTIRFPWIEKCCNLLAQRGRLVELALSFRHCAGRSLPPSISSNRAGPTPDRALPSERALPSRTLSCAGSGIACQSEFGRNKSRHVRTPHTRQKVQHAACCCLLALLQARRSRRTTASALPVERRVPVPALGRGHLLGPWSTAQHKQAASVPSDAPANVPNSKGPEHSVRQPRNHVFCTLGDSTSNGVARTRS